jgi:hypothetical protein
MSLKVLLDRLEHDSPEVTAAIEAMPPEVRTVVMDFKRDYLTALTNFKEAYLSAFSWATRAMDELVLLRGFLEAERLREAMGLGSQLSPVKCQKNTGNDLLIIPCDFPLNHEGPCGRHSWPVSVNEQTVSG